MSTVIYPGTFDPVTLGHVDLIERAGKLFDHVVIAVAASEKKRPLFTLDERIALLEQTLDHVANCQVVGFRGLLINLAAEHGSTTVIRGVRAVTDFEYEFQLASMNRAMQAEFETVFLTPAEHLSFISSSLVREIAAMGGDVGQFVPAGVRQALAEKFKDA